MHKKYFYLAMMLIITGTASLSMHVFISQYFQAPEVRINPFLDEIINFSIRFCTAAASIFIYVYSKQYWVRLSYFKRVILFTLLNMALTESLFRNHVMNLIVGNSLIEQFLFTIVPTYLKFFSLACVISLLANLNFKNQYLQFLIYLIVAVLATLLLIFAGSVVPKILSSVVTVSANNNPNLLHPPYGLNVLIPAYITYLEPTIASFVLLNLIKEKLVMFNTLIKGLILGAIITSLHAGLYSIIQITHSEGNLFYRVFYYGQFLWEYFILGIFTAYSARLFNKQAGSVTQHA